MPVLWASDASMDLLLLAQDVTWGGRTGDAVHLRELARHLARRGHAVRVIARGDGVTPVEGVEVHLLRSRLNLAFDAVRRPLTVRALVRAASERRPDLIYSRSFGDVAEAIAARALGVPLVFEVNGDAIAEREVQRGRPIPAPVRAWRVRSAQSGFRGARTVVAVTETLRRRLAEDFRVPSERIRVVPNAADLQLFYPRPAKDARAALGLSASVPVVCFVGNLVAWQGLEVLLCAFAEIASRHPEAILLVVGHGIEASRLRELAETLGLSGRARFVGAVAHEDVPVYMAASDVGVAPMTRERLKSGSSAIKIYEYLGCERPVIASRIPGLEFLEEENLGMLVPPEDPRALAAALDRALTDETWCRQAGARGRAYVGRRAGWPAVAAAVEDVCRQAVGA